MSFDALVFLDASICCDHRRALLRRWVEHRGGWGQQHLCERADDPGVRADRLGVFLGTDGQGCAWVFMGVHGQGYMCMYGHICMYLHTYVFRYV